MPLHKLDMVHVAFRSIDNFWAVFKMLKIYIIKITIVAILVNVINKPIKCKQCIYSIIVPIRREYDHLPVNISKYFTIMCAPTMSLDLL